MSSGRRATIYRVIQEQRTRLKSAGKQVLWEKNSDDDDDQKVDVVIVLSDSKLAESLVQILSDQVPQVHVTNKHYPGNPKQFLLITGHDECLQETVNVMGLRVTCLGLTSQQRQTIVKYYLDSLRMSHGEIKSSISVREGQVVLPRLLDLKHIHSLFPLHSIADLKKLHKSWVSSFASKQPLDEIEEYFGSSIAMYFAYLGHYTSWLLFPTAIGVFIHIMDGKSSVLTILFTITSFVWSALYIESLRGVFSFFFSFFFPLFFILQTSSFHIYDTLNILNMTSTQNDTCLFLRGRFYLHKRYSHNTWNRICNSHFLMKCFIQQDIARNCHRAGQEKLGRNADSFLTAPSGHFMMVT